MAKQLTLFHTCGKASCHGEQERPEPTAQSHAAKENCGFDDLDFLGDDLTEAELIRACALAEENCYKETPAPFHIGPSASEHSILNCSVIEDKIPGFDPEAGEIWIYPTNYPVRDYQFSIVHKSLFVNTLVCLPTGLGKTFIAAVVMYNFYRWYPHSKVVFLAPTKPLVAQQIEACFSIMGIPQEHTAEMTGSMLPRDRALMWQKKRVFFLTPQVMQNDLSRETCPVKDVTCVVFDEAHKALGNYAYCQVIKKLSSAGDHYRVIALSATPGNDIKAVQHVVTNLQIAHIELRTEESFDIQAYVHERKVEKIVVPLEGDILDIKNRFEKVLSTVLGRLYGYGVLYHANPERMSKFQLLQARDQFRTSGPPEGIMAGAVEGDFALAISLFHAYELVQLHGLRSFHQFLRTTFSSGSSSKQSMARRDIIRSPLFSGIMRQLTENLQGSSSDSVDSTAHFPITIGTSSNSEERDHKSGREFFYSHPKLQKLEEVVLEHFSSFKDDSGSLQKPADTRVMIFSQYRESVQEISDMLGRHTPLVKAMTFVGHSSGKSTSKGLTQKEQTEIVRKFREGGYNTLVATCVGEEGLDIGEVDLIVCFDAAKSPIRMVQRMGRTGRKRSGRIVVLVAAGKEESMYNKSQSSKRSIHRAISEGCKNLKLYQKCPRMVPRGIHPHVHKMHMTVGEFVGAKSLKKLANSKGKEAACRTKYGVAIGAGAGGKKNSYLNMQQLSCWSKQLALSDREFRTIEKSINHCLSGTASLMSKGLLSPGGQDFDNCSTIISNSSQRENVGTSPAMRSKQKLSVSLSNWTHLQTAPIQTKLVEHSSKSYMLMSLLEFADLLHTTEGMGESYDLEKMTFLSEADIKAGSEDRQDKGPRPSKTKKRKVIVDMSDDEDFVMSASDKMAKSDTASPKPDEVDGDIVDYEDAAGAIAELEHIDCEDAAGTVAELEHIDSGDGGNGDGADDLRPVNYVTASQHMVPKPPGLDSLDWLDDLEPSQTRKSVSKSSTTRGMGEEREKEEQVCKMIDVDGGIEEREFNFVTPKAPPCRRASRLFPSRTPTRGISKISTSTPRKHPCMSPLSAASEDQNNPHCDSMDLFEGLSSKDIFDDFSVSGLQNEPANTSGRQSNIKEGMEDMMSTESKFPHVNSTLPINCGELEENDVIVNNFDISMIAESDLELNWDEEKNDDAEVTTALGSPAVPLPPASPEENAVEQDSSYQLNVGTKQRKRRKVIRFLESPSPENSHLNARMKRRDEVSSSFIRSPAIAEQDLGLRGTKDFPVMLESSDEEDFQIPKQKTKKQQSIGQRAKRPKTTRTAADEFVDEQAQVSSGCEEPELSEEGDCDVEDLYDMEDSFINDNSMLTQYISHSNKSQKNRIKAHSSRYAASPLDSQRDDVFTRRKCHAARSRYRMVFSQRYKLLHHYMNEVDGGDTYDRLKQQGIQRRQERAGHSDSEADEVDMAYEGEEEEEDWNDLSRSLLEDEGELSCESVAVDKGSVKVRRLGANSEHKRARFMSESDEDKMEQSRQEEREFPGGVTARKVTVDRTVREGSEELFDEESTEQEKMLKFVDLSQFSDVLISPSLLKVTKLTPTPRLFSPEFDDWFSDIDYTEDETVSQVL